MYYIIRSIAMVIVSSGKENLSEALDCDWESESGSTVFKELIKNMPSESIFLSLKELYKHWVGCIGC